jgi:hypothetical protein
VRGTGFAQSGGLATTVLTLEALPAGGCTVSFGG